MIATFVAIALILLITYALAYQQRATPDTLYLQIFELTYSMFYQPEKLKGFADWMEHSGENIKTDADAVRLANEMLEQLDDPYTVAIGTDLQNSHINFECTECVGVGIMVMAAYENVTSDTCEANREKTGASCRYPTIGGVLYNSPAAHAGLKAGDAIMAVDGWSTAQQPLSEVLLRIGRKKLRSVTLTIERNGVIKEHTLRRQFLATPTVWGRMIDKDIAYLRIRNFESWSEAAVVTNAHKLRKAKAVVVDVRDNPGGDVDKGVRLPTLFMRAGHITTLHVRVPGTEKYQTKRFFVRKGELIEEVDGTKQEYMGQNLPDAVFAGKPIAVLVNENSASAAEMFAGALRDSAGAILVGMKTFGKGVQQSILHLFGGVVLRVTSGKYFLPSGYWPGDGAHDKRGIDPHFVVPPSSRLFDMGSDEDEQLRVAVEQLRQKLK